MMPLAWPQVTALAYQAPSATSVKALLPLTAGRSARLYSTVANMARVMGRSGANRPSPTPANRPRAAANSAALLAQWLSMSLKVSLRSMK